MIIFHKANGETLSREIEFIFEMLQRWFAVCFPHNQIESIRLICLSCKFWIYEVYFHENLVKRGFYDSQYQQNYLYTFLQICGSIFQAIKTKYETSFSRQFVSVNVSSPRFSARLEKHPISTPENLRFFPQIFQKKMKEDIIFAVREVSHMRPLEV